MDYASTYTPKPTKAVEAEVVPVEAVPVVALAVEPQQVDPAAFPGDAIVVVGGEARITSTVIAEGTKLQHKNVMELIRTYKSDLEDGYNPVAFQTLQGKPLPQGGFAQAIEIALLNEPQSTLLMTYMRNSEIVRDFKKRLVKAFYNLRDHGNPAITPAAPQIALDDPFAVRDFMISYCDRLAKKDALIAKQAEMIVELQSKAALGDRVQSIVDSFSKELH